MRGKAIKALSLFLFFLLTVETIAAAQQKIPAGTHSFSPSGRLLLTGSSTMQPLVAEIGKRFQALYPGVRVDVEAGGSGRGLSDARQGKADIGMVSRALTEKEGDLYGFPIARDGVCVILHRSNPVRALTDRQVSDIFTGRISNWKQVRGRKAPIIVIIPKQGYSSVELFMHYFTLKYAEMKAHQVVGDNPTRIKAISENPDGISFVSVGEAERKAQGSAPIKLLSAGGVDATSKNIETGNFPISRPLTLVTKGLPKGLVKEFIEFSLSSHVSDLISTYDFVPYMD